MTNTMIGDKPAVLFDGACPLCVREVAFYRRLRGADSLDWVDVSKSGEAAVCGVGREQALARFHVVMPGGEAISGAAGFVQVWKRLPAFRPLAWMFSFPGGVWLLERAYLGFLRIRPFLQKIAASKSAG